MLLARAVTYCIHILASWAYSSAHADSQTACPTDDELLLYMLLLLLVAACCCFGFAAQVWCCKKYRLLHYVVQHMRRCALSYVNSAITP